MSSQDLITVVVPVYGVEEYLAQCIESIQRQVHKNLEIVLVDDGSRDQSGAICDAYAARDSRISVIHKPNGGLVSARKTGAESANGEFLGFVDADDWLDPGFFAGLHRRATEEDADLVVSGFVREFLGKHERVSDRLPTGTYDRLEIESDVLPVAIFNGVFFQHGISTYAWNKLFRREAALDFIRNVPDQIVMGEDAAFTYPYLASCNRLVICDDAGYYYRQRANSIVKSVPSLMVEFQRLSVLFQHLKRSLSEVPASMNIAQQLRNYFFAQVLVRSGGLILSASDGRWYSPFPGLAPGQELAVYSSGSFGQHLVSALERTGSFRIAAWMDDDVEESQRQGLPVTSLADGLAADFDVLLVAAIDSEYVESLLPRIERAGVDRRRVSHVKLDAALLGEALTRAGFDLDTFAFSPPGEVSVQLGEGASGRSSP